MLLNPKIVSAGDAASPGNARISLVKIDVAAVYLGKSTKEIFNLVEGGSPSEPGLLFVFNTAKNPAGYRRDLRFWLPELKARAEGQARKYHEQPLQWVISQILPGNRQKFNAGDVDRLFQLRPNTRIDYGRELPGESEGGRNIYCRTVLETFLTRRWLGVAGRPANG